MRKKRALLKKLSTYSTAAGAVLITARQAGAAITLLTPENMTLNGTSIGINSQFMFAGTEGSQKIVAGDFLCSVVGQNRFDQPAVARFSYPAYGNATIWRFAGNANGVYNLPKSSVISRQLFTNVPILLKRGPTFSQTFGFNNFEATHSSGYVGFRFFKSNQAYFGWFKVGVMLNAGLPMGINFLSVEGGDQPIFGAYGLASDAIRAGVPEPSTVALAGLGLLALGAAGVRELRRQKAKSEVF